MHVVLVDLLHRTGLKWRFGMSACCLTGLFAGPFYAGGRWYVLCRDVSRALKPDGYDASY